MRRWAGYGYLALTSVNLLLYAALQDVVAREIYTSSLLLIDVGFCFFILFFFRRFR